MSRRTNKELIAGIRDYARRNCIHELERLRYVDVPDTLKKEIEEHYKESFNLWWNSWIAPAINEIERRLVKPRRRKESDDGTSAPGIG